MDNICDNNHEKQAEHFHNKHVAHLETRQRIGLTPSDGQDAYTRSSARSSRRSRPQRMSYLLATGHLDPSETEQLNKPSGDIIETLYNHSNLSHTNPEQTLEDTHTQPTSGSATNTNKSPYGQSSTSTDNNHYRNNYSQRQHQLRHNFQQEENIFANPKKKNSKRSKQQSILPNLASVTSRNDHQSDNRGKFRQTYTEVTLPMKTSPAFEYILKDNKRRNKRCCLWFIYSILLTICLAIITFCCVQLLIRYNSLHWQVQKWTISSSSFCS